MTRSDSHRKGVAVLFSDKLLALRKRAGLTQLELAMRADVGLATVKDLEGGRRSPGLQMTMKLAAALGTTLAAFEGCTFSPAVERKPPKKRKK